MSETAFILIVEDERPHAEAIAEGLRRSGHVPLIVESGEEALESIRRRRPDVVITDYKLEGKLTGMDVLRQVKRLSPSSEVIFITAHGDERLARDALKEHHAYDYITKPLDLEAIRECVGRAARQARSNLEIEMLRQQAEAQPTIEGIIANSSSMQQVLSRIRRLASSKLTVLIYGESGTGKELIARAIHNQSDRKGRPWLATNCAGFSEGVLESELFGHVKGAFTGAVAERRGLFEEADGGTLFLDEIGDMPLQMQAKLLRTLENGEIVRVGSNKTIHVDVRVVAATHRNLKEMVEKREFRDDLFWRLNQAYITLAPLRDRREDIPPLINHFIQQANELHGKNVQSISPETQRLLMRYGWPGNVRQLQNVIGNMVVMATSDKLDVDDITDPAIRGTTDIVPAGQAAVMNLTIKELEKLAIQAALRSNEGNRERAAKQLGIGARTLYRKLRDFGIE